MADSLEGRTEKSSRFRSIVQGVGRLFSGAYWAVRDFVSPDEPIVHIHRTAYERQLDYADQIRRDLIVNGRVEPNYADYLARQRAGLTR